MSISEVLAGLFGGLNQGLGQVQQSQLRRQESSRQDQQLQLQRLMAERQNRSAELNDFESKLGMLGPDADVDPELAKQGATLGLTGAFTMNPGGGIRKAATISDKLNQLKMEAERKQLDLLNFNMDTKRRAMDPGLAAKLMSLPREERDIVAQQYGINDTPLTGAERQSDADLESQRAIKVAQIYAGSRENVANIRGPGGSGGANGAGQISPSMATTLAKLHKDSAANPTVSTGWMPKMFGGATKPSPEAEAYQTMLSTVLTRFNPRAVADARALIKSNPTAPPDQILEMARQHIQGFDDSDALQLEPILRLLKGGQ